MSWSLKVGQIFGIDLKIHFSFLLILIWGAFNYGGSAGPLYGMVVVIALFTLVVLHELGHSLAAMWYGIPVRDITLLPIGGVARLERMPEKPIQELVVAIAGPAVNVVIAGILLPIVLALTSFQTTSFSILSAARAPGLSGLLTFMLVANVSLVIFNMLPVFPLDGGRVFRAFMGFFVSYQNATKIAVTVGRFFAISLGLFAIFYGQIFMALIAFFIFIAGGQERQAVIARGLLRNIQAQQALTENSLSLALSSDATIGQAASMMLRSPQPNFPVLDSISGQFVGVATSQRVSQAMQTGQWHQRITGIMYQAHHIPCITLTTPLDEVQDRLGQGTSPVSTLR